MPKLLKDIAINEVSAVDRGAGEGVKVLLMKRAPHRNEGDGEMPIDKKHEEFLAGLVAKNEKRLAKKAKRQEVEKAFLPSEATFYETLGKSDRKAFRKMSAEERAAIVKAGKFPPKKKPDPKDDDSDDDVDKRIDTAANDTLAKALKANESMAKRIEKMEFDANLVIAKRDAVEMGLGEEAGEMLLKARGGDKESIAKLENACKQLRKQRDEAATTGKIFTEFGKTGGGAGPKTALDELNGLASDLRKADPKLTHAQAFDKVYSANPELAARERDERMAKINKAA